MATVTRRPGAADRAVGRRSDARPAARTARWRPRLSAAVATLAALTLGGTGIEPASSAASQAPAALEPSVRVAAAEPEPTPTPSPTPRPTPWPTPKGVKGVDVSHWNGFPDFEKLYRKGMRFVFSKATQGTSFVDDTFKRHTREARSAGLLAGAYHFFDYRKGGAAQARHFLSELRSTTGLDRLLPLVVDVETLSSLGTPNKKKARYRLHALLDELYRQTGRYPMIYTSRYMWDRVVGGPTAFGGYRLWVACWKCDTVHLPAGWSDWDFWQVGLFRFGGGLKLDGNVYRSSAERLGSLQARPLRIDADAEWTADRTVEADLRGFDAKDVRVAIGEEPYGDWRPYAKMFDLRLSRKQGKQDIRIQLRSFRHARSKPFTDAIKLDSVAPAIVGPRLGIVDGARIGTSGQRVPARLTMESSDKTSGLARTRLRAVCDGALRASKTRSAGATQMALRIDRGGCTVKGAADDQAGNTRVRRLEPRIGLRDLRSGSKKVRFRGAWKTTRTKSALGRTLARTSKAGSQARLSFDGAQFAIVARRGPSGGRVKVFLDDQHIETIDLYAAKADTRRIVLVRSVKPGRHALKLRATGTSHRDSKGSTVWLDAVLVLDRRR